MSDATPTPETEASAAAGATPSESPAQIVRKQPKALSQRDPGQLARAFAESGYWKDVKSPAQAVVKMAAGEELGLTPLAAMQGITIIEGRIGYTGNLIATLLRQHEHYDYKVLERGDESCTLQFLYDGEPIDDEEEGKVTFSVADAERAELVKPKSNWVKYPRAMCFNRALTEGARTYCPDLTAGTPVYSTDEIEEVITVDVVEEDAPEPSAERLDPEIVGQLAKGIDAAGLDADDLGLLFGSLGLNALHPERDRDEQLAELSVEDAEKVNAELQRMVDADAAKGEGADDGE